MDKKTWVIISVVACVGLGLIILFLLLPGDSEPAKTATSTPEITRDEPVRSVIGTSVEGREIEAYTFGNSEKHVAFVGGIHGGYEWNSILLAYQMMDHLEEYPEVIPDDVRVTIIPSANPDGLARVMGTTTGRFAAADAPPTEQTTEGRFNANGVDLNRNFDCNWAPESSWRGETVSAGTEAFSEPEAIAIRTFVQNTDPDAVIFWHSAAGAVYGSECNDGILPGTLEIMNTYADAAGYAAVPSFDAYPITGDVEGWLASIGVPSITVELSTHEDLEWEKNKAGVEAILRSVE
ncbi:MAG: M14 family metallopeptidase [Candidatus Paceibacterota bacterium]